MILCFFFSSRRRHTRFDCDWSSDVCSSDLRSYSTPARPSSPASPTTPSSPSPALTQPSPSLQRPSFFGGLMGGIAGFALGGLLGSMLFGGMGGGFGGDRKSTRLNSSHSPISYAVFCLKKKK